MGARVPVFISRTLERKRTRVTVGKDGSDGVTSAKGGIRKQRAREKEKKMYIE